ncbi:TR13B factor, partial [Chloroceryle aenea]|nr:TR13B factor [Chloroceryle aenea]
AMNNCTDQQYWDPLVCQCIPCSVICSQPTARCAALCGSADVDNDKLRLWVHKAVLRALCWGRDQRVVITGFLSTPISAWPTAAALEATPPPPSTVLEQKGCPEQDPWLVVYLLLGLCLCALICSLLLGWTHLRRKGEVVSCQASTGTCHRREDSSKDRLVEAGSVGDGSTSSRVPEPVETCGFCFPGHSSAIQETKSCHSTSHHLWERAAPSHSGICSTGSAGAIPSPDDGHFKIICSPSQEKTPMV